MPDSQRIGCWQSLHHAIWASLNLNLLPRQFLHPLLSTVALGNCSLVRIIPLKTFLLMDLFLLGRIKWVLLQNVPADWREWLTRTLSDAHFKPARVGSGRGINTKYGDRSTISGVSYQERLFLKKSLSNYLKACLFASTNNSNAENVWLTFYVLTYM